MKHHCHCRLGEKVHQLRAGKLGLIGGILLVGHLLFHVAECLVIPALIVALRGETVATSELNEEEKSEYVTQNDESYRSPLRTDFYQSLMEYSPLKSAYQFFPHEAFKP